MSASSDLLLANFKRVLEVNSKINSTLDLGPLLEIIMQTAAEVMQTEAASLLLLDEQGKELIFRVALGSKGGELLEKFRVRVGEGIAGAVAADQKAVIVNDTASDARFAKRFDQSTGFKTAAILCVPLSARGKLIGVLEAINPKNKKEFNEDDLLLCQTFADQAAIAIENARMHGEILKQERAKQELKIAAEIQKNFLPDLSGASFSVQVAAATLPAREVGGDFYDILDLGESKTGLIIGDVSGKGVPAALYMVRAITQYRFLAPRIADAGLLVTELNRFLAQNSPFGMFVTLLYVVLDSKNKTIDYCSAGHHAILKKSAAAPAVPLEGESGPPAGLDESMTYPNNRVPFDKGDLILLYTDGILEARNPKKEEFGLQRIQESLQSGKISAADSVKQVLETVTRFAGTAEQHDDMTLLAAVL